MTKFSADEILKHLRDFVAREDIEILPLAPDAEFKSPYDPVNDYLGHLKRKSKPETALEGLFRAIMADVLNEKVVPQVGVGAGYADYKLEAAEESSIIIELKSLFQMTKSGDRLRRDTLIPTSYTVQIEKYLQHSEYVVLTDLHDVYLYSTRDLYKLSGIKPCARLSFAGMIEKARETHSLLDVLRAAEDGGAKPDLDSEFFAQLKEWFAAFANVRFKDEARHDELVIQLINQLIFAKTMEDHSLVQYRFLQNEWESARDKWSTKGAHRTVWQFLKDFETFFNEYYDTELFERSIWESLDQDPQNLARFAAVVEAVLGLDLWNKTFTRGIVHYNYRLINEDIFGKSYEMFLASNRKDEGIYYTPATITTPMADSLVDSLFNPVIAGICDAVAAAKCDFKRADELMEQLSAITLVDTASGSGGFLIKALRAVWRHYQRIDDACAWAKHVPRESLLEMPASNQHAVEFRKRWKFDAKERRILVAQIMLRHIFAVDKDAGAIEVAKTNLWKEAVRLSRDDYNFRKLTGDINKTLPSLRMNFVCADSLVDVDAARQLAFLAEYDADAVKKLCALRQTYIADPSNHAPLDAALALRDQIRARLLEHVQTENLPCEPILIALSFFPAWFAADGKPNNIPGFDGVIGNPPWEAVKPVRKEFSNIGKYSMSIGDFDDWFEKKLKGDSAFAERWKNYQDAYATYKDYLDRRFKHQGTGDWNYFKLFIESNLNIVRNGGRLSVLVPSGIQTDEGCSELRKLVLKTHSLTELSSFENRGYTEIKNGKEETVKIFPDVDNRYKFGFLKITKGISPAADHTFDARFYLHNPAHVYNAPIKYSAEMVERFSPQNFSIMEFRSERDYTLCTAILGERQLLGELGLPFRRELHMTEDAHFFKSMTNHKLKKGESVLFEGKMIHQFNSDYAPANYYVSEKEVAEFVKGKELFRIAQIVRAANVEKLEGKPVPAEREALEDLLREIWDEKKFILHSDMPRLAYRKIGRSTDERTIIASMAPAKTFLGESLNYLTPVEYEVSTKGKLDQIAVAPDQTLSLLCLLNSLTLNFYIRSKISANVNLFYLYELPIPKLTAKQKKTLAEAADKLLGYAGVSIRRPLTDKDAIKAIQTRAELEVFIARDLYGLTRDDWQHLTGTFTFGGDSETKAELDAIIARSRELWTP